jgi:hypothetical protein
MWQAYEMDGSWVKAHGHVAGLMRWMAAGLKHMDIVTCGRPNEMDDSWVKAHGHRDMWQAYEMDDSWVKAQGYRDMWQAYEMGGSWVKAHGHVAGL